MSYYTRTGMQSERQPFAFGADVAATAADGSLVVVYGAPPADRDAADAAAAAAATLSPIPTAVPVLATTVLLAPIAGAVVGGYIAHRVSKGSIGWTLAGVGGGLIGAVLLTGVAAIWAAPRI